MSMRSIILLLSAVSLTACATSAPSVAGADTIPHATLKAGECGLFGWATGASREFIFFADKKSARFMGPNGAVDLVAQTKFPSVDYIDDAGNPVTLRLGQGEVMSGGSRFPGARLVTLTEQGWERFQPVAIIQSCQPK